ncbi:response regulator [Camelimonas abortus]|uniref:Response regulator n=1 Tax=Camelimonas abortus TaxID=1017184 RepID=A0ABV7LCV4_9HYPH
MPAASRITGYGDRRKVIEQNTPRIVIADDHPLFRGALRQAIARIMPQAEIAEAGDFAATTEVIAGGEEPDVVLLDLSMPGVQGFSGLLYLRAQYPGVPVVIVSGTDDPAVIRKCMEFGASGFVPKSLSVEAMGEALAAVLAGGVWTPPDVDLSAPADRETADLARRLSSLTPQQVRVLMMLSEGLLNKQIAYELNVSEATIKAHVSAILQKLGVESRTQAVIVAARMAAAPWAANASA